jgi:hypothetical protein
LVALAVRPSAGDLAGFDPQSLRSPWVLILPPGGAAGNSFIGWLVAIMPVDQSGVALVVLRSLLGDRPALAAPRVGRSFVSALSSSVGSATAISAPEARREPLDEALYGARGWIRALAGRSRPSVFNFPRWIYMWSFQTNACEMTLAHIYLPNRSGKSMSTSLNHLELPINSILDLDADYAKRTDLKHRRRYGQFFTPPKVASLMADWILQKSPARILDPALGTGALIKPFLESDHHCEIVAYEIDKWVLSFSNLDPSFVKIKNEDFLNAKMIDRFDGVTMNPPYIRHREIEGYAAARGQISVMSGFIIPKSANLYIYFAMKAALHLAEGGRASFLLPTEWMNSNFGLSFKRFLLEKRLLKEIVVFSGCSNIFDDALTTASILLLEKTHA